MPKQFFFTVCLLIKSDSHLEKSISSVISDEKYFKENIQLILIDSVCSDFSMKICTEYTSKYPDNICFIDASGKNDAEAYNDTRSIAIGTYISFIDNYGIYSKKVFQELYNIIKSGKIPVVCIKPLLSSSGENIQPYIDSVEKGIVRLREHPEQFILMLGCYFFNRKKISSIRFDSSLTFFSDIKMITEVLLSTYSYIYTDTGSYTTSSIYESDPFRYVPQYSRAYYTPNIEQFIIPMLKNYAGSYIVQMIMMYLIALSFSLNADEKYKYVIIGQFVEEYFNAVSNALKFIDDSVIMNPLIYARSNIDSEMPFRFIRMKYNNPSLMPQIDFSSTKEEIMNDYYDNTGRLIKRSLNGEFVAHVNQAVVGGSRSINADVTAINYDREGLFIDASLSGCSFLSENDFSLFAEINGVRENVIRSNVYTLKKFFDVPFLKRYSFRFFVPVSKGKKIDTITLKMKYQSLVFRIGMTFTSPFARLSNLKNSYYHFLDRVMVYDRKSQSLIIRKATDSLLSINENKLLSEASKKLSVPELLYYRQLRKALRRRIKEKNGQKQLLFYDDMGINYNGNLLFRYFCKNKKNDSITLCYVDRRDSGQQRFLINAGYENIYESGSKKAKIEAMASDIIFATDCDVYESLGFNEKDMLYLRDLFSAEIVSIKNFFMTYATAQFDNRLRDNTQLFFAASENEKNHVMKSIYDYDESMIHITGYPILDTISDKKKRRILIAPGDRRQFVIYNNSDFYRFSESRFFNVYNSLICDTELIRTAKENNYTIDVLMPQSIEKFIGLFHSDDTVKLHTWSEKTEEQLVSLCAMLVTDYSELQYRFAYLNKPVVYYYPENLPIQQEYKNEKISRTGFGELLFTHDKLVGYLIAKINDNCRQSEKYSKRCRSFFRYNDKNNCSRIMDTIMKRLS